jgi:hypothetical protein
MWPETKPNPNPQDVDRNRDTFEGVRLPELPREEVDARVASQILQDRERQLRLEGRDEPVFRLESGPNRWPPPQRHPRRSRLERSHTAPEPARSFEQARRLARECSGLSQPLLLNFDSVASPSRTHDPTSAPLDDWHASGLDVNPRRATGLDERNTATPSAPSEIARARDILGAVRTLQLVEGEGRAPDPDERASLLRFGGFGPVALQIFPDPVTGRYRSSTWQTIGEDLSSLLAREEYDSAKRSTFNAFYTSQTVIDAM